MRIKQIITSMFCMMALSLVLATVVSGQTSCPDGSQCVSNETITKAAQVADELRSSRDVIAKFQIERSATEAERAAAQVLIKGLNDLLATKDKIIGEYERINELYKKAIDFQQIIIERYEKMLNKPKSGFQKFLTTLKEIALVLAGITLGRGI